MPGPYAICLALATVVIIALVLREAARAGLARDRVLVAISLCALGAVLGSKYLTLDFHASAYGEKTFLGAVVGGMGTLVLLLPLLEFDARAFDVPALPLLAGAAIGRMGCLLSGCCHGVVTNVPWGIRYDVGSSVFREQLRDGMITSSATTSLAIHPTQAYESVLDLVLAACMIWLSPRFRRPGSTALATVAGLALIRFGIDPLRATAVPAGILTQAQWTTLGIAALALCVLLVREVFAFEPGSMVERARRIRGRRQLDDTRWLLLAVPAMAVMSGAWLTPLERIVVMSTLVLSVAFMIRSVRRCLTPIAGGAALLMQVPIDRDSIYPHTFGSVGAAISAGTFNTTTEDCEGNTTSRTRHTFHQEGVSAEVRREWAPGAGMGVRLNAVVGKANSGTTEYVRGGYTGSPYDTARTDPMRGVSAIGSYDWGRVGLEAGVVAGTFPYADDYPVYSPIHFRMHPAAGVRLGRTTSFFSEISVGTSQPVPFPLSLAHVGIGLGEPTGRSTVRLGISEGGGYVNAWWTRRGLEFAPQVTLSTDGTFIAGMTFRRRFYSSGER